MSKYKSSTFWIKPANTARTRQAGLAAFFGRFLAGDWFRQIGLISSRPPAGTPKEGDVAHRWAEKQEMLYRIPPKTNFNRDIQV